MARPREFDESAALEAAGRCFWERGYEATSVRNLIDCTGLTTASLYNAFGDKRALYEKSLRCYVENNIADRIKRCEKLPPLDAIESFFAEVLKRSLRDPERKGCMLVNAAQELVENRSQLHEFIVSTLGDIELFFLKCVRSGQKGGTITRSLPAASLARHLLAVLMGIRTLARVRAERALLEDAISSALKFLKTKTL